MILGVGETRFLAWGALKRVREGAGLGKVKGAPQPHSSPHSRSWRWGAGLSLPRWRLSFLIPVPWVPRRAQSLHLGSPFWPP